MSLNHLYEAPELAVNTIDPVGQRFVVEEEIVGVACGVPVSVLAVEIAFHPAAFVTSTVYAPASVAVNVALVPT